MQKGVEQMNFLDLISVIVWDYMWGMPLVLTILGTGVYLTFKTGGFQFLGFRSAGANAVKGMFKPGEGKGKGLLSSAEAMSAALGTTVGVGNIGGVATAIATGGPGAVFWMWVAATVGMIIKTAEITLAVHYRSTDEKGGTYGGPNYYMKKGIGDEMGLKKVFKALSGLFAFGFLTSYFINIQTYTVSEAVSNTFGIPMTWVGVVYTVLLYGMISGGVKGIGRIASWLVPFMCIFYILGGGLILLRYLDQLPKALYLIVSSAFTGSAAMGGFAGAAVSQAMKVGFARSVFSNEAGWGSAPMIHSTARVDHPVRQGLMGIFEVFVDTFIICTVTCLVIVVTGKWSSGLDGATLTLSAFETGIGRYGRLVLALAVFIFGLTTSGGVYAQMEVVLRYLLGNSAWKDRLLGFYKWTYPIPSLLMVYVAVWFGLPGTVVWVFSDASTALPIFANVVALWLLAPKFLSLLEDYRTRYMRAPQGETLKPLVPPFYDEQSA
ncbi:LOW QUALITY PROTEIN: amino acid carrier protein [Thermanaerovibrio velox DSM 12556]|uniref:Amino acid carrier protein n=2 Tax=Thermanaerovibrio TaxID=81461 RepID=H0UR21_9BACT|nr:LOW QUALITY PROTEIN: amino acid carrier protein [Thermanaerovibrio velox DSM 12556]